MSAAPQVAEVPKDVGTLHRLVQKRVAWVVYSLNNDNFYAPLRERFEKARQGTLSRNPAQDLAALEADLKELLDAPEDVLRRMAFQGATSARCIPPVTEAMLRTQAVADQQRRYNESLHPRVSPAELVEQFASRGIVIEAGADGNLHVKPADRLTDADRRVLVANKPGIIQALPVPAVVI